MQLGFVIDQSRCIGCHACTVACKSENDVPVGNFRTWVKYTEEGAWPAVKRSFAVLRCNQCTEAPCVAICPVSALTKRRQDGIVDIDPEVCIGCKACLQGCPYDALYLNEDKGTVQKCHFCAHRVEIGLAPACAIVCPTEAIIPGDFHDPGSRVSRMRDEGGLTVRKHEAGTGPNVLYKAAAPAGLDPTLTSGAGGYLWSQRRDGETLSAELSEALEARARPPARTVYTVDRDMPWGGAITGYLFFKSLAAGLGIVGALLLPPFAGRLAARSGALPPSGASAASGATGAAGAVAAPAEPSAARAPSLEDEADAARTGFAERLHDGLSDAAEATGAFVTSLVDGDDAEQDAGAGDTTTSAGDTAAVSGAGTAGGAAAGTGTTASLAASGSPSTALVDGYSAPVAVPLLALLFLAATLALLVADLKRPERFYTILTRPNWRSWLARGSFVLLAYNVLLGLWLLLGLFSAVPPAALGFLLALPTMGLAALSAMYTGWLFRQAKGRVLWMKRGYPLQLLVQACLAGAAFLLLAAPALGLAAGARDVLSACLLVALCGELLFVLLEARLSPDGREAEYARTVRLVSHGPYARAHWVLGVLTGLVVPGVLLLLSPAVPGLTALAGALALLGLWFEKDVFVRAGQALPIS